jgi:ferritin-like metal-binding protein YciE
MLPGVIGAVRELYTQRLSTMLWVEETLADELLPSIIGAAGDPEVRHALERHLLETETHARTLRRLVLVGRESAALLALRADLDLTLAAVEPEPAVRDLVYLQAVAQTEHLELAAYEALVATARSLGDDDHARDLQAILEQEEFALEEAVRLQAKLLAETAPAG